MKIQYTDAAKGLAEVVVKPVSRDAMERLFHQKMKDTLDEAKRIGQTRADQLSSITDTQMRSLIPSVRDQKEKQ